VDIVFPYLKTTIPNFLQVFHLFDIKVLFQITILHILQKPITINHILPTFK